MAFHRELAEAGFEVIDVYDGDNGIGPNDVVGIVVVDDENDEDDNGYSKREVTKKEEGLSRGWKNYMNLGMSSTHRAAQWPPASIVSNSISIQYIRE